MFVWSAAFADLLAELIERIWEIEGFYEEEAREQKTSHASIQLFTRAQPQFHHPIQIWETFILLYHSFSSPQSL